MVAVHALAPQQLFAWRRAGRQRLAVEPSGPVFVPAVVAAPAVECDRIGDRRHCNASGSRRGCTNCRVGDPRLEGLRMIGPTGEVRVMVATKPVDFRKGAEGLAALVREDIKADPFSGTVYVFRAKRMDRVKLVFWDGTGVCLFSKRLEDGEFRWPKVQDGVIRLSAAQLSALLEGLDWRRVHEPRETIVPLQPS
jgi:transposase